MKWTISVREVRSTFEVWFIKGEVDHQCEEAWSTFEVELIKDEVDHEV